MILVNRGVFDPRLRQMSARNERRRFYVVITSKCNSRCAFCHMRALQDSPVDELIERVDGVMHGTKANYSISVTGGDPLHDPNRLRRMLDALHNHRDRIRWIGIATNGTYDVDDVSHRAKNKNVRLYLSRHHYDSQRNDKILGGRALVRRWGGGEVRLNCNLIRGGIDSTDAVLRYMDWAHQNAIRYIWFRAMTVADKRCWYEGAAEYADYRQAWAADWRRIIDGCRRRADWTFREQTIRPYIYHEGYDVGGMQIFFRAIDETQLFEYNQATPDTVDEYVLWPDGQLNGCWDRRLKLIERDDDAL